MLAEGWCSGGFSKTLDPVFEEVRGNIGSAIGVVGERYTIELYHEPFANLCFESQEPREQGWDFVLQNGLAQIYFYSSVGDHRKDAVDLENHHPASIAWHDKVENQFHIQSRRELYRDGKDMYFRRVVCVPVTELCSTKWKGVLVVTSMQEEEFGSDVFRNLAWLSSLSTQFIENFEECQHHWLMESNERQLKRSWMMKTHQILARFRRKLESRFDPWVGSGVSGSCLLSD